MNFDNEKYKKGKYKSQFTSNYLTGFEPDYILTEERNKFLDKCRNESREIEKKYIEKMEDLIISQDEMFWNAEIVRYAKNRRDMYLKPKCRKLLLERISRLNSSDAKAKVDPGKEWGIQVTNKPITGGENL